MSRSWDLNGFTRANLDSLWIDPVDYQQELYRAASFLADSRMHVSIYNHQLCVLDKRLWPFARKSICDWKYEYMPECEGCREKENCGGFFTSAKLRYSDHIQPFADIENRNSTPADFSVETLVKFADQIASFGESPVIDAPCG
jgi:hypothetical protein